MKKLVLLSLLPLLLFSFNANAFNIIVNGTLPNQVQSKVTLVTCPNDAQKLQFRALNLSGNPKVYVVATAVASFYGRAVSSIPGALYTTTGYRANGGGKYAVSTIFKTTDGLATSAVDYTLQMSCIKLVNGTTIELPTIPNQIFDAFPNGIAQ